MKFEDLAQFVIILFVIASVILLIILFTGEPDLADAWICNSVNANTPEKCDHFLRTDVNTVTTTTTKTPAPLMHKQK